MNNAFDTLSVYDQLNHLGLDKYFPAYQVDALKSVPTTGIQWFPFDLYHRVADANPVQIIAITIAETAKPNALTLSEYKIITVPDIPTQNVFVAGVDVDALDAKMKTFDFGSVMADDYRTASRADKTWREITTNIDRLKKGGATGEIIAASLWLKYRPMWVAYPLTIEGKELQVPETWQRKVHIGRDPLVTITHLMQGAPNTSNEVKNGARQQPLNPRIIMEARHAGGVKR